MPFGVPIHGESRMLLLGLHPQGSVTASTILAGFAGSGRRRRTASAIACTPRYRAVLSSSRGPVRSVALRR